MAVAVSELSTSTLRELNEASNSTLGSVGSGTGSEDVTTQATLYDYLTQAQNEWVETAYPLMGSATYTWPSGAKTKGWGAFTYPSGQGRLFGLRAMAMGSTLVALDRIGLAELKASIPGYEFVASGTPVYYYEEPSFVGVHPAPSNNTAASLYGVCLPVPIGDGTGGTTNSIDFMPDDLIRRVLPLAAAILLAQKAFDDPSIFGRLDHLIARYVPLRDRYRAGVSEELRTHLRMPEIQARRR